MGYYILFIILALAIFWASRLVKITPKSSYYRKAIPQLLPMGEVAGVLAISLVIAGFVLAMGMFSEVSDTELLNGKVTSKEKDKVSCRHSYNCNCKNVQACTGSGKDRSCSTRRICDTCYDHPYDYDWLVHSTIGDFDIDRIDRQGVKEPSRWTQVKVGDPTTKTHTFVNYLKAARGNVLNREGTKISYPMPTYPMTIYDYYKVDRAVSADNAIPNLKAWSNEISEVVKELGTTRELNLVMVFTKAPEIFADQLNAAWIGSKKNDVVVVIGTTDGVIPDWVKVLSWSKREDFKVSLREDIMGMKLVPAEVVQVIAGTLSKQFERRQMKEFAYLRYDIEPSFWFIIAALILFFIPIAIGILAKKGIIK